MWALIIVLKGCFSDKSHSFILWALPPLSSYRGNICGDTFMKSEYVGCRNGVNQLTILNNLQTCTIEEVNSSRINVVTTGTSEHC